MSEPNIHEIIESAVGEAFNRWAASHPSLAAVIDRVRLNERTVESLRTSEAYRQALAAYHRNANDMAFFQGVLELAAPLLARLLGG